MEKITVSEAFRVLQEKYGVNERDRQVVMAEYFSAPLYYKPFAAGRSPEDEREEPTKTTAVVEGGTGIGKTLAYLLPALLAQKELLAEAVAPEKPADVKKISRILEENVERSLGGMPEIPGKVSTPWKPARVLISTSTKLLQGQILDKDLQRIGDFLQNEFGAEVKVAVAQGVGNFLCGEKIKAFLEKDLDPDMMISGDATALISLAKKIRDGNVQTLEDAKDLAKDLKERDVLRMLADGESMFSPPAKFSRCGECKTPCKYFSAMMAIGNADVVVTNHHWTAHKLIRKGLSFAKMTPEEREEASKKQTKAYGSDFGAWVGSAMIIADEAHQFEEAIVKSMTTEVRPGTLARRISKLVENVEKHFGAPREASPDSVKLTDLFNRYILTLKGLATEIEANIEKMTEAYKENKEVDNEIWRPALERAENVKVLAGLMEAGVKASETAGGLMSPDELRMSLSWQNDTTVQYVNSKAETMRFILDRVLNPEEGKKPNFIFDCSPGTMSIAPISVAPMLRGWSAWQKAAKIFTSATIATSDPSNPFRYFVGRLGVNPKSIVSAVAKSPFNYKEHACVLIPNDLPDPGKDPEGWVEYQKQGIVKGAKMTDGGALVLFTSRKQMQEVYAAVEGDLKAAGLKPAMQGDASMATLRDAFVKNKNAVVFGLDSFWQGLDVPGQHLRNLMMMRLPFDPPNDPLIRANAEWEKERISKRLPDLSEGALNGMVFRSFQVPRAVLNFRQGFGRLIRTEEDKGIVTVFDPRVTTKSYGDKFLAALPKDIPIVRDWETAAKVTAELGINGAGEEPETKSWVPRRSPAMAAGM